MGCFMNACAYFGILVLLFEIGYRIYRVVYPYVIAPSFQLWKKWIRPGDWAVITGSTDGIGKAISEELASRGLNIFLLSRSLSRLQKTAEDITSKYGAKTRYHVIDFTTDQVSDYLHIRNLIDDITVGVLVNNVGMTKPYPDYYETLDPTFIKDMVHVNCLSYALMTSIVLPKLKDQGRGVVINVSSILGHVPAPLVTLYSASKSFQSFLGQALYEEYKHSGILFQTVMPGSTATKLTILNEERIYTSSTKTVATGIIDSIGTVNPTDGCLFHALQTCFCAYMPVGNFLWTKFVGLILIYLRREGLLAEESENQIESGAISL